MLRLHQLKFITEPRLVTISIAFEYSDEMVGDRLQNRTLNYIMIRRLLRFFSPI